VSRIVSRRRHVAATLGIGALVAVWVASADAPKSKRGPSNGRDLFSVYAADCPGNAPETDARCAALRVLVTQRLLRNLEYLEAAGDGRGVAPAIDALDLDDPEIQQISLRIIGPRNSDADVQRVLRSKVVPLLLGDRPALEVLAAEVLVRSGDAFGYLGAQFKSGHPELAGHLRLLRPGEVSPAPTTTADLHPYPGATRYPPGESDRSLGFMTTASVDQVVATFGKVKVMNRDEWVEFLPHQKAYDPVMAVDDDPLFVDMQRLIKQAEAAPDPKLAQKIQQVGALLEAKQKRYAADHPLGVVAMARPALAKDEKVVASARWLVLERRGDRIARMAVVYRDEALARTVEILIWDPRYYPRNAVHGDPDIRFSE